MKIGYRTHPELMKAWELLGKFAFHPQLADSVYCIDCDKVDNEHHKDCLVRQAQELVVDAPAGNRP